MRNGEHWIMNGGDTIRVEAIRASGVINGRAINRGRERADTASHSKSYFDGTGSISEACNHDQKIGRRSVLRDGGFLSPNGCVIDAMCAS